MVKKRIASDDKKKKAAIKKANIKARLDTKMNDKHNYGISSSRSVIAISINNSVELERREELLRKHKKQVGSSSQLSPGTDILFYIEKNNCSAFLLFFLFIFCFTLIFE